MMFSISMSLGSTFKYCINISFLISEFVKNKLNRNNKSGKRWGILRTLKCFSLVSVPRWTMCDRLCKKDREAKLGRRCYRCVWRVLRRILPKPIRYWATSLATLRQFLAINTTTAPISKGTPQEYGAVTGLLHVVLAVEAIDKSSINNFVLWDARKVDVPEGGLSSFWIQNTFLEANPKRITENSTVEKRYTGSIPPSNVCFHSYFHWRRVFEPLPGTFCHNHWFCRDATPTHISPAPTYILYSCGAKSRPVDASSVDTRCENRALCEHLFLPLQVNLGVFHSIQIKNHAGCKSILSKPVQVLL